MLSTKFIISLLNGSNNGPSFSLPRKEVLASLSPMAEGQWMGTGGSLCCLGHCEKSGERLIILQKRLHHGFRVKAQKG